MKNNWLQVDRNHYGWEYLSRGRFLLWQKVIDILSDKPFNNVLELGVGPGVIAKIMNSLGKKIVTCDFDIHLNPDVLADIRALPFKKESFDLIIALQILEHIPYEDFVKVLKNLNKISKNFVLFSVPYNQHHFEFYLNFKIMKYLFFKGKINNFLQRIFPVHVYMGISRFRTDFSFDGEHYWEIGYKNFGISKIRNDIRNSGFLIMQEQRVELAPYYYIFLLQKMQ